MGGCHRLYPVVSGGGVIDHIQLFQVGVSSIISSCFRWVGVIDHIQLFQVGVSSITSSCFRRVGVIHQIQLFQIGGCHRFYLVVSGGGGGGLTLITSSCFRWVGVIDHIQLFQVGGGVSSIISKLFQVGGCHRSHPVVSGEGVPSIISSCFRWLGVIDHI